MSLSSQLEAVEETLIVSTSAGGLRIPFLLQEGWLTQLQIYKKRWNIIDRFDFLYEREGRTVDGEYGKVV